MRTRYSDFDGRHCDIRRGRGLSRRHRREDTSNAERRLEQGQILELNRRADLLNTYRESAAFEDSENLARSRGFYLQRQRRTPQNQRRCGQCHRTSQDQCRAANAIDLQSEEQFAIARMYRRIRDYNYVGIDANDTIEVGIEKNVARELSEAGYGAAWTILPKADFRISGAICRPTLLKIAARPSGFRDWWPSSFWRWLPYVYTLPPDGAPLQRRSNDSPMP